MQRSEEILEAVKSTLLGMSNSQLRALAEDHGIDISGLSAKGDLVEAIALYPGIARVLEVDEVGVQEEPAPEEVPEEEEPVEAEEPEEPEPPQVAEETREPSFDRLKEQLKDALRAHVDFSESQEDLAETARRFKGRGYDAAIVQAKDAVARVQERIREYVRASWAFAIASAQRIWDTSDKSSKAAKEAKRRLAEAVEAFQGDGFLHAMDTLKALSSATLNLYAHEMEAARAHVDAQSESLRSIEAMGGDTAAASTLLQKGSDALEANDRFAYLDLIKQADGLVGRARQERIEEIREAADNVDAILEEARNIGAAVDEAAGLLQEVRRSLEKEDFVSAHELVGQAERASLEAQQAHMDRVTRMRDEQVEKVRELIGQIKPLVDEAKSKGFDTSQAAEELKGAAEHVKTGDYVNALLKAKKAYRLVKSFRSQLEAQQLEKAAPEESEEETSLPTPEAPSEPAGQGGPACPECGHQQSETGLRGKVRCESCGAKFRV